MILNGLKGNNAIVFQEAIFRSTHVFFVQWNKLEADGAPNKEVIEDESARAEIETKRRNVSFETWRQEAPQNVLERLGSSKAELEVFMEQSSMRLDG